MEKRRMLDGIDTSEEKISSKKVETPKSTMKDMKKLEHPASLKKIPESNETDKLSERISKMNDREKIAYYRKNGLDSLADNRNAVMRRNEQKGDLNYRLTKMNSHNMDKLSCARNTDPSVAQQKKESFAKWSPEGTGEKSANPSLRNHSVLARHVKEGEKGTITHNKEEQGSGNFISKGSMGKTADARIINGALYPTNRAEEESKVELNSKIKNEKQEGAAKTHNIIIGQAGPQPEFDKKADDGIKRTGGARQIITDGGYGGGAIKKINDKNN